MAVCWVILRAQQIYTVIQAVHSLLYIVAKCNFFSVVTWKDIIKYLQKCEGCTHFCEILYIYWEHSEMFLESNLILQFWRWRRLSAMSFYCSALNVAESFYNCSVMFIGFAYFLHFRANRNHKYESALAAVADYSHTSAVSTMFNCIICCIFL